MRRLRKKLISPIGNLITSGMLIGTGAAIGGALPGTTGTALTGAMSTMAGWTPTMANVAGAGMVMNVMNYLPRPKFKQKRRY